MSDWVKNILYLGSYQILFLDKVPKSAAVNESVNLCKKYNFKSVGLVNAILRKIEKSDYKEISNITNSITRISLKYSMPEWIVKKFCDEYGEEETANICQNLNLRPDVYKRQTKYLYRPSPPNITPAVTNVTSILAEVNFVLSIKI